MSLFASSIIYQRILASFWSFSISSSISLTLTPPFFFAGSYVSTISTLLGWSPNELNSTSSMFAFLAFIIWGNDAIFGVLSLRSHVMTAGDLNFIVSRPVSTYLVTSTSLPLISTFEAKVAWGQFNNPAKIWPVWLQSSSTDCFPKRTRSIFYLSTKCLSAWATMMGWRAVSCLRSELT